MSEVLCRGNQTQRHVPWQQWFSRAQPRSLVTAVEVITSTGDRRPLTPSHHIPDICFALLFSNKGQLFGLGMDGFLESTQVLGSYSFAPPERDFVFLEEGAHLIH